MKQVAAFQNDDRILTIERIFEAAPQVVFSVWSNCEHISQWFGPSDFKVPDCTIDFRVGGRYKICMLSPDGINYWVAGEYLVIEPPERLEFTWQRFQDDGVVWCSNIVRLSFEPSGINKTKFTLHQAMFETSDECNNHRFGWTQCLERLQSFVNQVKNYL